MPYSVSFQEEGFVLATVASPCSEADHYAAMEGALALCARHDCSRLLVDLHDLNTESLTTIGCFRFGSGLAERAKHIRIAHVLPSEARSKDDVSFTSTVEANRGITTAEFETYEEAKDWLVAR